MENKERYILGLNGVKYPIANPIKQHGLKKSIVELVLNLATPDDDCMLSDFLHALQYALDQHPPTPAVDELNLIQSVLDYLHKNITASIVYEDFHDFSKGIKDAEVDYFPETANELIQEMGVDLKHTDSTHQNHASFVALVEGRLSEINIEIEKTDPHNYDRHNELCSVYDELTDLLTKIKL